jgi:hypothetical protein
VSRVRIRYRLVLPALHFALVAAAMAGVDTAWVRRYSGPSVDWDSRGTALAADRMGSVYVTGASWGRGMDYATVKYGPDGNLLWVARYDGPRGGLNERPAALAVDAAGSVYVTGASGGALTDYATVKYGPDGQELWARTYNGTGDLSDRASALVLDDSGCVYVTGESRGAGTGYDFATIKYTPAGDETRVWRFNNSRGTDDKAVGLVVDDSGSVFVTGWSIRWTDNRDIATLRYSPAGQRLWVSYYNGPADGEDWPVALALDDSGNVTVSGISEGADTGNDYLTVRYDRFGRELWTARYDGPGSGDDRAVALAVDDAGCSYVTGISRGAAGDYDYATVKYGPDGQELWVARYDGPANAEDRATAVRAGGPNQVWVTGGSVGTGGTMQFATIKYVETPAVEEPAVSPGPAQPLRVAPNPARNRVHLAGSETAELYAPDGRRVAALAPGENDVRQLPRGVYFVRRQDSGESVRLVLVR